MRILAVACIGLALVVSPALSGGESLAQDEASHDLVRYQKDQGLVLETKDGGTSLWLGLRFQLRYTNLDGAPVDPATLPSQDDEFSLNRGRIKGGGHIFLHKAWEALPEPLELAFRYGVVDPDTSGQSDLRQEYTFGANWFFHGHRNKVTADTSYLDLDDPSDPSSEWRFRLQYELSI